MGGGGRSPADTVLKLHAEGGTRTPTGLRPLAPEASASTSSTTSAIWNAKYRYLYNSKSMLGLTLYYRVPILTG